MSAPPTARSELAVDPKLLDALNAGLLALQAALLGSEVYEITHATIRRQIEAAVSSLRTATEAGNVLAVQVEDRVVWEGQRLPDSARLVEGLFMRLDRIGVDGLTIRPGFDEPAASAFLENLADPKTADAPSCLGGLTISPAFLEGRSGGTATDIAATSSWSSPEDVHASAHGFASIWNSVAAGETARSGLGDQADGLAHIVDRIAAAVRGGGQALLPMADLKRHDEYTFVHTVNVGILAAGLAEAVGLNAGVVRDITVAALLHDVGKRRTPLEVLNKAGKLEEHELRIMRKHPVDGAKVLFDTPGVPDIAPIIAFEHHINLDGTGYPHVKPGYTPHLGSQITQLADVFDALRTHRPYRQALPLGKVLEIMGEDGGTKFDRHLLSVFFERVVARSSRDTEAE